jgi:hypothetical protein
MSEKPPKAAKKGGKSEMPRYENSDEAKKLEKEYSGKLLVEKELKGNTPADAEKLRGQLLVREAYLSGFSKIEPKQFAQAKQELLKVLDSAREAQEAVLVELGEELQKGVKAEGENPLVKSRDARVKAQAIIDRMKEVEDRLAGLAENRAYMEKSVTSFRGAGAELAKVQNMLDHLETFDGSRFSEEARQKVAKHGRSYRDKHLGVSVLHADGTVREMVIESPVKGAAVPPEKLADYRGPKETPPTPPPAAPSPEPTPTPAEVTPPSADEAIEAVEEVVPATPSKEEPAIEATPTPVPAEKAAVPPEKEKDVEGDSLSEELINVMKNGVSKEAGGKSRLEEYIGKIVQEAKKEAPDASSETLYTAVAEQISYQIARSALYAFADGTGKEGSGPVIKGPLVNRTAKALMTEAKRFWRGRPDAPPQELLASFIRTLPDYLDKLEDVMKRGWKLFGRKLDEHEEEIFRSWKDVGGYPGAKEYMGALRQGAKNIAEAF